MKVKAGEKRIQELLEAIKGTDIVGITYEKNGLTIGLRKKDISEKKTSKKKPETVEEVKETKNTVLVTSQSVGLFRDYVSSTRKSLAKEKDIVEQGQKIGAIESMNIFKDIVSPVKGRIVKKYVSHNNPVEYGQKLFEIEEIV